MAQVIVWDDDRTKKEILKRFANASEARKRFEDRWARNERIIYSTNPAALNTGMSGALETDYLNSQGSEAEVNMAYTFKNFRFIHAQMSANPPSVAMKPTSSDQDDHRKADAADRIVRWSIRQYKMQERVDTQSLGTLLYGTGFVKTVWDSTRGDIVDFDDETDEIRLEGDIAVTIPFIWNMYLDPDAKSWDDVKYIFEKIYIDYEEACARWPGQQEILEKARINRKGKASRDGVTSNLEDEHYNCVELLEYWEIGLPTNGQLGRYCITTLSGDVLDKCRPSPFRFRRAGAVSGIENSDIPDAVKEAKIKRLPEQANLPYHILTDIDIPNVVWGRSFVEYAAQLQDNLNQLDSAQLDNVRAHSAARMVLNEQSELADESLSDNTWDIVKITGTTPPYFVKPPELMPDMAASRAQHLQGINDLSGVNEAMFGQQSREQSGASMQYATNQGNMIRRRLFNKYVLDVESIYKSILNLVRKHWTVERCIHVLGKERALEAIDIKGADIDGGYDVIGEYGVTLSLDPVTRREEIISLQPMFEKAGIPMRTSLKMMKLNELEGMYDELELADSRQKEIFDAMISSKRYIDPKPFRDHTNMIAFAMRYFMSQEFESLPIELQQMCERHIQARAALAAQEKAGALPDQSGAPQQPPGAPGPVPQGGAPLPSTPEGAVPQPAADTGAANPAAGAAPGPGAESATPPAGG